MSMMSRRVRYVSQHSWLCGMMLPISIGRCLASVHIRGATYVRTLAVHVRSVYIRMYVYIYIYTYVRIIRIYVAFMGRKWALFRGQQPEASTDDGFNKCRSRSSVSTYTFTCTYMRSSALHTETAPYLILCNNWGKILLLAENPEDAYT